MKKLWIMVLTAVLLFSSMFGNTATAFAEETEKELEFDYTDVLDDLTSSSENGEQFNFIDYPYNENGRVQLITLAEYCYSYAANMRDNYALYLYIYNPQNISFETDSILNKAEFAVGYNEQGNPNEYDKFTLKFCSKSTGDYDGLFYKFRVIDHIGSDGKTMGDRVNSNGRRYDLSGFELITKGTANAEEYNVGGTFTYSGYAKGYGPDVQAESTLSCDVEDLETLVTEVNSTVYRPEGNFYNGEQDQLSSVYFTVPNYFFEEYGVLSSIVAEWYEYRTNPVFVTEDALAAQEYAQYIGIDIYSTDYQEYIDAVISTETTGDLTWINRAWTYNLRGENPNNIPAKNVLAAVFETNGARYEDYSISSERLQQSFLDSSKNLDGEKVNEKYARSLFSDTVDAGHIMGYNRKEIFADEMHSLTSYYLTQNWFQKLFGSSTGHVQEYESIRAIEDFGAEDTNTFLQSDEEIAAQLYADINDVGDIKAAYESAVTNDARLVFLRFATGKYYSYPAMYSVEYDGQENLTYADRGYVAEEPVYLDFDLISATFGKDGVYTVIPFVASPIDVIGPVTPPLDKDPDFVGLTLNEILIIILIVILAVIIVIILVNLIGKALSRPKVVVNSDGKSGLSDKETVAKNKSRPDVAARAESAAKRAERAAKSAKKSADGAKKTGQAIKSTGKGVTGGKARRGRGALPNGGKAEGNDK